MGIVNRPQTIMRWVLVVIVLPLSLALGDEDELVRYPRVGVHDTRNSEMDLRLAIADRELAKSQLELAQSKRLSEIHTKVAEQSGRLIVLLQKAEYVSDILRASAENPYGVIGVAMQGDQGLSLRTEQMRKSGKISRDGESIDELQALDARVQDDLRKIAAEHDQLLAVVKQNQENYYREQVLENQQQMISQQQEMIKQQQRSGADIEYELQDIERRLRNLR